MAPRTLSHEELARAKSQFRAWVRAQKDSIRRQGLPVTADEELAYVKRRWPRASYDQQNEIMDC